MPVQFVGSVTTRADHIWYLRIEDKMYKCVLCGEVSRIAYSAADDPDRIPGVIETLTHMERLLEPYDADKAKKVA